MQKLLRGFRRAYEIIKECERQDSVRGYITSIPGKDDPATQVYDEFMPFKSTGLPTNTTILEYDNVHLPLPPSRLPPLATPSPTLLTIPKTPSDISSTSP